MRVQLTFSYQRLYTFSKSGTERQEGVKASGIPEIRAEAAVIVGMSECAAVEQLW